MERKIISLTGPAALAFTANAQAALNRLTSALSTRLTNSFNALFSGAELLPLKETIAFFNSSNHDSVLPALPQGKETDYLYVLRQLDRELQTRNLFKNLSGTGPYKPEEVESILGKMGISDPNIVNLIFVKESGRYQIRTGKGRLDQKQYLQEAIKTYGLQKVSAEGRQNINIALRFLDLLFEQRQGIRLNTPRMPEDLLNAELPRLAKHLSKEYGLNLKPDEQAKFSGFILALLTELEKQPGNVLEINSSAKTWNLRREFFQQHFTSYKADELSLIYKGAPWQQFFTEIRPGRYVINLTIQGFQGDAFTSSQENLLVKNNNKLHDTLYVETTLIETLERLLKDISAYSAEAAEKKEAS